MVRKKNKKTPSDLPLGMTAPPQQSRQGQQSSGGTRPRTEATVPVGMTASGQSSRQGPQPSWGPRPRTEANLPVGMTASSQSSRPTPQPSVGVRPCSPDAEMTGERGEHQQVSIEEEEVASGMTSLSVGDQPSESPQVGKWRAVPSDRLGFTTAESEKIISEFPRKPKSSSKIGRPIALVTNLYPLKYSPGNVYHYDVEILSVGKQSLTTQDKKTAPKDKKFRCLNTRQNREVFEKMVAENRQLFSGGAKAVYDGMKNAIASSKLDLALSAEFMVELDQRKFLVQIKPVSKEGGGCALSLAASPLPRESVAVLEMVLKHNATMRFTPVMQSFFTAPVRPMPLTRLSEMWQGHHQSVRLAERGPVVTLNTCASAFYKAAPLTIFFEEAFGMDSEGLRRVNWSQTQMILQLQKQLKGLKVETNHQSGYNRKWKVEALTQMSAQEQTFQMDGVSTRVVDYFREKYGVNLRYPNLPCIVTGSRKNFFPVEVCTVVSGQRCKDRSLWNPEQMIKYSTETPSQKFDRILEIRESRTQFDQDAHLRAFQLSVDHRPLEVEGRTLNAPSVMYHDSGDSVARPMFGSWNLKDRIFLEGASIRSWVLISFANVILRDLRTFAEAMTKFALKQGMDMGPCQNVHIEKAPLDREQTALESFLERVFRNLSSVQLAVVVVPDKNNKDLYTLSKQAADKVGVTVQCMQAKNAKTPAGKPGPSPSLVVNILMKVNEKMGGVNASLRPGEMPALMRDVMFVGADVTHPSPIGELPCSVVGVVATMDDKFGTYAVTVRAQESKPQKHSREVIQDFQEIAECLLREYQRRNKKLPKHVVVYRDGVSDGEIPIVQKKEVDALGKALRSLGIPSAHKTYIVVQKRHHVRMKPKNPRDGDRRTGNPPPGTMVDSTITHPFLYDFFMYPHNGLQGTSKPIYCMVVQDTSSISRADLYTMTYQLCHLFAPCTKSISSPAPVRYADKAAYVGRSRLESRRNAFVKSRGEEDIIDFCGINEHLAHIEFKHIV